MNIPRIVNVNIDTGKKLVGTMKKMDEEMYKLAPKSLKTCMRIDKWSGEAFNIIINAIGTAAVAPIFIAYNPLSKADENTKKYSAMRQPISAALAVLTQCGIVIPWNKMIDSVSNNGKLGQYFSKEAFQDSKYLYSHFKKLNPNMTKEELNNLVKDHRAEQYGKLYANLVNEGKIVVGNKQLSNEDVSNLIFKTCNDIIEKHEKALKRYKEEKLPAQIQRAQYLTEYFEPAKTRLTNLLNTINGQKEKDVIKTIKAEIKKAKSEGASSEWINILQNDLLPKGDKHSISKQINGILAKAQNYMAEKAKGTNLIDYIKSEVDRKSSIVRAQIDHFKGIQSAITGKKDMKEILNLLTTKEITSQGINIKLDNAGIMVVEKYIKSISKRIQATKAISGLLVSLAIMPLTCHALNYLYPRFMDKFFPELANAKKKGGNK